MQYVKMTVAELMACDTTEKICRLIHNLCNHVGQPLPAPAELKTIVETYYRKNRVVYTDKTPENAKKIMSWIDCVEFLQHHFHGKTELDNVKVCFEYHTPDDRWIDVILLDDNRMTLLEFKSGMKSDPKTLTEHEEQLDAYLNKIIHGNQNVWHRFHDGFRVEGFLVYTNGAMGKSVKTSHKIKVCDRFCDVVNGLHGTMEDAVESEVMRFDDIVVDSSTLSAFLKVLKREVLDGIYVPDRCKDRCMSIIDANREKQEARVNIIFVNGKPGSGKTGVALGLLSEYLQRDEKKEKKEETPIIRYATGNGNLFSLFNQATKTSETKGNTAGFISKISFLYDRKRIVDLFAKNNVHNGAGVRDHYKSKTKADIVVIDEAQRMWSADKVAIKLADDMLRNKNVSPDSPRTVIKNGLSEPMMVLLDIYADSLWNHRTKTIVFLIGNGQEIYSGEELGEDQILHAVAKVSDLFRGEVSTKVYSSRVYDALDPAIQDDHKENRELFLMTERRNTLCAQAGALVDALFRGEEVEGKNAPFVIVGTAEELNNRYFAIKAAAPEAKQRLMMDSFDQKRIQDYISKPRRAIDTTNNPAELYDFFQNSLGDKMEVFATEFDAQGLETDYVYFIWGDAVIRRGNRWVTDIGKANALNHYYSSIAKYNQKNPDFPIAVHNREEEIGKMMINAYRVLLTRAQRETIVYVKDAETRAYLEQKLHVK